jgi:macrophage erythroblast attacher
MSFGFLDEIKTIEHSTLKVPYETLNKQYRNVQKSIDRDCSSLNQAMLSIEKLSKNGGMGSNDSINRNDLLNSFTNLVEKLKAMRKRSLELKTEEDELFELLKKRLEHLKDCYNGSLSVVKSFKKSRVDRILIDYFLRSSYYDTAQLLASKANIQVN